MSDCGKGSLTTLINRSYSPVGIGFGLAIASVADSLTFLAKNKEV